VVVEVKPAGAVSDSIMLGVHFLSGAKSVSREKITALNSVLVAESAKFKLCEK